MDSSPSGSVKLVHLRGEMESALGEVKPLYQERTSVLDIAWHPSFPMNVTTFNVVSWLIMEKNDVLEPSASPAGLFSFSADLSTGQLISVSAGPLDHASLVAFITSAAPFYPHLDQEALTRLALENAQGATSLLVRHLFTSYSIFFSFSCGPIFHLQKHVQLVTIQLKLTRSNFIRLCFRQTRFG